MKYIFYNLLLFSILFYSCENAKDYKSDAEKYYKEKKYEDALNSINNAIRLEPDSIGHYAFRILLFDLTGRHKEEMSDLSTAIELNKKRNSKSLIFHHQRAVVKLQLGLYKEALLDIDYFIENRDTVGNLTEAYLNKGSILYKMGDLENAENFYELALKENIGKEKSLESQGLVGLANLSKSPQDALKLLDKAIAINDSCATAYGSRGVIYLNLAKIDLAQKDFKKAISYINQNEIDGATIYFNMGQLFLNYLNNSDSATKYFEQAIKLSPQSPNNDFIYMNLGCIRHRSGDLDNALINFQKAETINPQNDILLYNFALLLSDLNRNADALEKINKAIKINSKDDDYFDTKGTILSALSSFKEAEIAYKKAIEINPKSGGAYYNLGYLLGEQNNYEQSIKYYDKAVLLNFDLEASLVNRALLKIKIKNTSSACNDLERAYKLGRTDIKPLIEKTCN